jgi:excinuclease ABC subunit C
MTEKYLKTNKLPDQPGVYIFRDYRKRPLYIGRATSLRDRVRSYMAADVIATRGPRIVDMVTKAKSLTWQTTDSVLEAILLESAQIKKYQPFYNVDERDDKSSQYVVITDEDWPRVFLVRARDFEQALKMGTLDFPVKKYFGPFPHSGLIKESLKILRRLFPFKDKKSFDPRHDAFYRAIGRSPLQNDTLAHEKYLQTIKYLILFFEGRKRKLRSELLKQMKCCADEMRFEEAGRIKHLLHALDHINDISLIKRDRNGSAKEFRIEAYDVAHLSGTNVVGVMTVSINGENASSEYRRFKITKDKNDDIGGLTEIISRRLNHPEWTYPDMIVVDGNETHAAYAERVLQARRIAIPIVAVAKDDRHKAARLVGNPELTRRFKEEIISINAEAHRFAIAYHRHRRGMGQLAG